MNETTARVHGRIAGLIFALVWLSCVWFGSWAWNPNNSTRLFAAFSIVEDGDATIDEWALLTIDKAQFGTHFYLDKAPGMTLMALPAVALADRVTGVGAHQVSLTYPDPVSEAFLSLRLSLAAASGPALLTATAAVMLFMLGNAIGGARAGAFAAVGFALGTPMWGWSTTIFGHAPVAALLVIAMGAIWAGTREARPSTGYAAMAGLALGWAVVIEYPALIEGSPLGIWALWRLRRFPVAERRRAMLAALLPAVAAGLVLLGYNLFAFGTPWRVGYQGVVGFDGMNQGVFGLTYPKPMVLLEVLLGGRRGMIWVAPVLLVGALGLFRLARDSRHRDLGLVALASVAVIFLYNAAYVYWDGGNSTGPRHAVPAIGFLALGLAPAWGAARSHAARAAMLALLGLSVTINLVIASAEITSGSIDAFPLWNDVFLGRFVAGDLRTLPSSWWGYSPWGGLALYLLVAAGIGGLLVWTVRRSGIRPV